MANARNKVDEGSMTATGPVEVLQPAPVTLEDILGRPLDEASFQRLEDQYPLLAEALRDAVKYNYSSQQIRHYAMQRGLPMEWVRWLEQAARHLYREQP